MTPLFGIVGRKNAGKTMLVVRLVQLLTERGHRVSTIKHAHHSVRIDVPGTDSFRHREAGATEVALVSAGRWALMRELRDEPEPTLSEIAARLSAADIVLVEGFKREPHPKIEVRRGGEPLTREECSNVTAVAEPGGSLDLDDVEAIADLVEQTLGFGPRP